MQALLVMVQEQITSLGARVCQAPWRALRTLERGEGWWNFNLDPRARAPDNPMVCVPRAWLELSVGRRLPQDQGKQLV